MDFRSSDINLLIIQRMTESESKREDRASENKIEQVANGYEEL